MEHCEDCGHRWHGLPCAYKTQRWVINEIETEECDCPTAFKPKVDISTPDL